MMNYYQRNSLKYNSKPTKELISQSKHCLKKAQKNSKDAKEYAEGKGIEAFRQVVADAYVAGYNAGYQDGYNKVVKDSISEGIEYVDLGLPSGTLWSSDYVRTDNGNAVYVTKKKYYMKKQIKWMLKLKL